MMRATIFFATGNLHKVEEVKYVLRDYSLDLRQLNIKGKEIQAEKVEDVAKESAARVAREHRIPVMVEDTGLSIDSLRGFPGPYAAYVLDTIGTKGLLKLLGDVANRGAIFQSAVAFCDTAKTVNYFIGESFGTITTEERGNRGFGFDSIFEPYDGAGKTFAEMGLEEKSTISHRSRAMKKFANWYVKHLAH